MLKTINIKDSTQDSCSHIDKAIEFLQNRIERRKKGLPVPDEPLNFSIDNFIMRLKGLQLDNE